MKIEAVWKEIEMDKTIIRRKENEYVRLGKERSRIG